MKKNPVPVREICMAGVFAAIIAVLSWISIPMPLGVPMTLQTLAVPLAGVILGPRKGAAAAAVYILLGAVGLPVFSGFTGGIGILLGPTGGFIWGFPLMAFLAGRGAKRERLPYVALGLLLGIAADYSAGVLQFMLVTGRDLQTALWGCVIPFLPAEALKAVLVGSAGVKCRRALLRRTSLTA